MVVVETHYKIIERVNELPERAHPFSISKPSVGVEFGRQGGRSRRDEKTSSEPMSRLHGSTPLFSPRFPPNESSTGFLPNEIPDPVRNSLRTEHVRSVSAWELNGRPVQDTSQRDSAPIRKG